MQKINFNNNWLFIREGSENCPAEVDLPHDAMMAEQRCAGAGNETGYFPGGKYTYVKTFFIPAEDKNLTVTFEFEGVYKNSSVYINGQYAGGRPYGYSRFYIKADKFLHYGGSNEIKVIADNSAVPNSRWYSGSGVYRDVNLIKQSRTHIRLDGVRITTLSAYKNAIIKVETDIACEETYPEIRIEIHDHGELVASGSGNNVRLDIDHAKLWSDETPFLYECRVMLVYKDAILETETVLFGVRTINWSSEKGLLINGIKTLLRGACIHHDSGILGAATFAAAEERRIHILKEAGFNAVRCSHNPASKALLDACDKLGMYVMDEAFDQWYIHKTRHDYASDFDAWHTADLKDMVIKDYNHPCVIMYSIGNEVSETARPKGVKLTEEMIKTIKSLDNTRPVTCCVNLLLNGLGSFGLGVYKEKLPKKNNNDAGLTGIKPKKEKASGSAFVNEVMSVIGKAMNQAGRLSFVDRATRDSFSFLDICGYNYGSGRYAIESGKYPGRVIVGSETFPPDLYENWQAVKKYPYLIGDFIWTGWDYLGEAGLGVICYDGIAGAIAGYPYLLAGCGIIDITGHLRPEVYWNKAVWGLNGNPYIGVEPLTRAGKKGGKSLWRISDAVSSWSWREHEGKKAKIVVYSNACSVELFLNNRSIGRKTVEKCKAAFETEYREGTLTAVAFDTKGREKGRTSLSSAGQELMPEVKADKTELKAGCRDIAFIDIAIADKSGIVECGKETRISVNVEGAGTLAGFGSANPRSEERFTCGIHSTYYGRAQAVIRSGEMTGTVTVTVTADGIGEKVLVLSVI